jgi:hypothetical protein
MRQAGPQQGGGGQGRNGSEGRNIGKRSAAGGLMDGVRLLLALLQNHGNASCA